MIDFKTLQTLVQHAALMREVMQPEFLDKFSKQVATISAAEQARQDAARRLIVDSQAAAATAKKAQDECAVQKAELENLKSSIEKATEIQRKEKAEILELKEQHITNSAELKKREDDLADLNTVVNSNKEDIKNMLADLKTREDQLEKDQAALKAQQDEADDYAKKLKAAGADIKERASGL